MNELELKLRRQILTLESELSEAKAQVDGSVAAALEKMTAQLLPAFEAERANWIAIGVARGTEILREREAKALMKCGHPKACWEEAEEICLCGFKLRQHQNYVNDKNQPSDCTHFRVAWPAMKIESHCSVCAELSRREAEAHAQTAAMLEKAVDIRIDNEDGTTSRPAQIFRDRIRDLIPTSYAAALAESVRLARLEEVSLARRMTQAFHTGSVAEYLDRRVAELSAARQAPEEKEPRE